MADSITVIEVPFDDVRVQPLVEQVQQEYVRRYGGPDETPFDPAAFAPPRGRFFLALRGGHQPLAMGGWRPGPDLEDLGATSVAEIKRMYVVPQARRTGLARLLIRTLEDSARAAGHDVMVLETGMRQPEAVGLYQSAGYVPVTPYGFYKCEPQSRYYGRRLVD